VSALASTGTAPHARPVSPYKGLAPFEDSELDELLFFGRERDREVIAANLVAARLTVLYGPSGVGKSSVLRAGVARDLRELPGGPLVVVHDAWSEEPARGLAEAVAAAAETPAAGLSDTVEAAAALHGDVFLLLDQLEAYFVYHGNNRALGEALVELLTRTDLPVHILLSIREDSLARLDTFKGQLPGLLANRLRLDHLSRDAGRRAIVGPLERFGQLFPEEAGLEVEPELVEAVLDGVRAGAVVQAGRGRGVAKEAELHARVETPYLQLVMQRLWEVERAAGSQVLRLQTLERLGGPAPIVEEHLERALAALTPAQKELAARMFNHLVTPSGMKISHGTRDLAGYARASEEELEPVLATLGEERILRPVGADGGEAAHEIYHDVLAEAVLAWRSRFDAERALAAERAAATKRHRRLLVVVGASLVALAITVGVAVFALTQRSQARAAAQRAHARELDANALTSLGVDPAKGLQDALDAARLSPSPQAEDVLRTTLLASRLRRILPAGGPVTSAAYSPDSRQVLTASADGKARLYDARSGALLRTLDGGAPLAGAVFDRTGRLVATAGKDGAARVLATASGRRVATLRHHGAVLSVAFSPGGGLLVTTGADGTARIWRVATWKLLAVLPHPGRVYSAVFNPDGSLIVTRSTDRYARVFETRGGRLVRKLDQGGIVEVATFSPNGHFVVTGGANQTARIWVARTGRLLVELKGHRGPVLAVAISRRDSLLATASSDGSARVWSFPQGQLQTVLLGHALYVTGVAFSPDGFSLVTTSLDGTARVWQPGSGDLRAVLAGDSDSVTSAAFNLDGSAVVTASDDGTARIWNPQIEPQLQLLARTSGPVRAIGISPNGRDVLVAGPGRRLSVRNAATGRPLLSLTAPGPVRDGAYNPDGGSFAFGTQSEVVVAAVPSGRILRRLDDRSTVLSVSVARDGRIAAGGADGAARIWGVDGRLDRVLRVRGVRMAHVAFSADGSRLVTATSDGIARVWNTRTGLLELTLRGHHHGLTSARFNADGTEIVTASLDHDARMWNAETGALLHVLHRHFAVVSDAEFSPDGRWIVTAGPTTAGLWDARSGLLVFFMRGHQGRLTSAAFDPSGRRIITASIDGTVRTYRCDICGTLDDLMQLAEQRQRAVASNG
jgi:WD40 repeat protein